MKILQANLNHHWSAQNLLMQNIVQYDFDLACVSDLGPPGSPLVLQREQLCGYLYRVQFAGSQMCFTENKAEFCDD